MDQLSYRRHRFPPPIIQHAIWLYLRFTLSYRAVEDLLAERGLEVSYETVRRWVLKFGPLILFPALRLGYLVVPHRLVQSFTRTSHALHGGNARLEQAVVARFMIEGH